MQLTVSELLQRFKFGGVGRLLCREECISAALLLLLDNAIVHLHAALHNRPACTPAAAAEQQE
jgi:hypothetical protein